VVLRDVVEVRLLHGYRLWLRFDDGTEGEVDLEPELSFEGIFEPLRDPSYFARVEVDSELGMLVWPNGADWDSLVLYSRVTGRPVEELLDESLPSRR
jgi:hypothetical protein